MRRLNDLRERSREMPLLGIIVGESGAGKTTFSHFVNRPEGYYSSSGFIEAKLAEQGLPINHDTIHKYAQEAYTVNPHWQVPAILGHLATKPYIILDGPRRVEEVRELKRRHDNTFMLRIATAPEIRRSRLKMRDGMDDSDVGRVVRDESKQLEIGKILVMADEIVTNDQGIANLQSYAMQFQTMLDAIKEDRERCLSQEVAMIR